MSAPLIRAADFATLAEAIEQWCGWGLRKPKTTARLAALGWFEKARHPRYGERWRVTDAGREAYEMARKESA